MAVTLSLFAGAGAQFFDNNGVMLSGGLVYTYGAGTTTPLAAYTSNTGATALSNPIVLDASGRVPTGEIWLTYGQGYKFTVKTSTGVLIGTYDNIPNAALPPLVNDAASISYQQGASVTAGNFIIGETYLITFIGSTNFQSIGAVSNTVGTYFIATGVGSGTGTAEISRTVQAKFQDTVSVKDFGAIGDGVADDTAAIQAAAQFLTGNQTLYFPDGTYLISYIWTPYSDSDPVNGIGRGRGVCYFNNIPNIRLYGPRATITCVNHNITANGGFAFAWVTKSPGFTIEGFNFDMTFTGYNTSSSYYPLCGGVVAYEKYAGAGTQATLCSNFTARDLTFKLYHPNGAFAITSNPYGGDNNNGFKILSVFASGDSAATTYSEQSRNLLVQNIKFLKGHNGYGCWGVGYNEATFKDIFADAWVAAAYTIATATYTGANFVAPVRFYQYYCDGLTVDNVQVLSLPWAERVGAFQGRCGGVSVESGLTDRFSGGASITNCTFVLDDDNSALGGIFDVGITSTLSGNIRISSNSFLAWTAAGAGVVCIYTVGNNGTGISNYTITGNIAGKSVSGPFVQIVTGNDISDANRRIKNVTITGNIVEGWGSEGAVYTYIIGTTYYGVENIVVSNNVFDGSYSATTVNGTAINASGRTSSDNIIVTHNVIKNALAPVSLGSSNKIITDNIYLNNAVNGTFGNFLTNNLGTFTTFTAGQAVSITIAVGDYYQYQYTEYSATGAIVTMLANQATSTTGTIRTVGAGNTGKLYAIRIANIK